MYIIILDVSKKQQNKQSHSDGQTEPHKHCIYIAETDKMSTKIKSVM